MMYWLNMILGLALIVAPFALGYNANITAAHSVASPALGQTAALHVVCRQKEVYSC